MIEDDDLPVLTQILRTGTSGAATTPAANESPIVVEPDPVPHLEETLMADQLVIGNEPHRSVEAYLALSFDENALDPRAHAPNTLPRPEPHADHGHDSFQLPQDHDSHGAPASNTAFQEPHYTATQAQRHDAAADTGDLDASVDPHASAHSATTNASSVEPKEDPAMFAGQVRDAVLEVLSARIETELDARIAQAIHAEVETALAQLQENLRNHLTAALHDVVGRAVDEEMARRRMPHVDDPSPGPDGHG